MGTASTTREGPDMQPGDAFVCAIGADEQAERLVRCARRLARVTGLRPLFVHVIDTTTCEPDAVWQARSLLRQAGARTEEMRVLQGHAGAQLVAALHRERAALALVATRGFGPLKAALLGSVSRFLMLEAPVPVMLLPRAAEPAFDEDQVLCGVDERAEPGAVVEVATRMGDVLGREVVVARTDDGGGSEELERLAETIGADVIVVGWDASDPLREVLAPPAALALSTTARRVVVVVPPAVVAPGALA
jgi:nucleotide-binding universal stress UspA family protein